MLFGRESVALSNGESWNSKLFVNQAFCNNESPQIRRFDNENDFICGVELVLSTTFCKTS